MSGVLRVNLAVGAERGWGIGRFERQLLEEPLVQGAPLIEHVEVAVFTIRVYQSVLVDDIGIDAPLETMRMIGNASEAAIGIARATLRIGVFELPLHGEVRAELRHEEFFGT